MSVLDKLKALATAPVVDGRVYSTRHVSPIEETDDLTRILALPRRPVPTEDEMKAMAVAMTARLRRERTEPCECARLRPEVVARGQNPCITELRPLQGWYLTEAEELGGVLGLLPVGSGKTALNILTAMVVSGCRLAILLIPSSLRAQFRHDYRCLSQHFKTPNLRGGPGPFEDAHTRPKLEVLAYSELSLPKNSVWFKSRMESEPKGSVIVLADEAHNLKDRKSTRTHRYLSVFAQWENVGAFNHSGSITTKKPQDYSHLAALCLREGSPLPLDQSVVENWAEVLAPSSNAFFAPDAGKLRMLADSSGNIRKGFHRRLVETRGVITTKDIGIDTRLHFGVRAPPPIPLEVASALHDVRSKEQRPDGEELIDALEVAAVARQVAAGFYLFWAFPKGEPEPLVYEWFEKRQAWNRELRQKLKHRSEHMDSPKLVRDAAARAEAGYRGDLPVWRAEYWADWQAIADKVQPVTRVKWISDWLMRDAAAWGKESPGIIWYENAAVGHLIAEIGGFVQYGPGDDAALAIAREDGSRTIVASHRAHGTGRNLQSFSRNLFVQQASDMEQCIGRSHRSGQPKDVVTAEFYGHTPEYVDQLDKATEFARYVSETTGSPQRLLMGTWANPVPDPLSKTKTRDSVTTGRAAGGSGSVR